MGIKERGRGGDGVSLGECQCKRSLLRSVGVGTNLVGLARSHSLPCLPPLWGGAIMLNKKNGSAEKEEGKDKGGGEGRI